MVNAILIGLTNEKGEHYQLKYDLNERLIEEVGFDGRIQQYDYDPAGQLIRHHQLRVGDDATDKMAGQPIQSIAYSRDAEGRVLTQTDLLSNTVLHRYQYDALGQLTQANNEHRKLAWAL